MKIQNKTTETIIAEIVERDLSAPQDREYIKPERKKLSIPAGESRPLGNGVLLAVVLGNGVRVENFSGREEFAIESE